MLMADTLAIFLSVLGMLLACPGLWLLCRGLWPQTVEQTALDCRKTLWKPFLVGIPITALIVFTVALVSKLPGSFGGISAVATVCLFITYASIGVAGLATVIGERLPSPADARCPWKATIRGGVVLELAYLLPILGWFLLLPASIIIGAGSTTRTIIKWQRKPRRAKNADPRTTDLMMDGPIGATP
jgi:hypothetical protein